HDADVADAGPDHVRVAHALLRNAGAIDVEAHEAAGRRAANLQGDARALGAAQHLEHVTVGDRARDRLSVDRDDAVAGPDAEPLRGRALERRDDDQLAAADLELDADARIVVAELVGELRVAFLGQVDAVRIEGLEHALDGALDQRTVVDRLDVIALDMEE